jgi:hypothetical protein
MRWSWKPRRRVASSNSSRITSQRSTRSVCHWRHNTQMRARSASCRQNLHAPHCSSTPLYDTAPTSAALTALQRWVEELVVDGVGHMVAKFLCCQNVKALSHAVPTWDGVTILAGETTRAAGCSNFSESSCRKVYCSSPHILDVSVQC